MITIRAYQKQDADAAREIWNEVVREGVAFPALDVDSAAGTINLLDYIEKNR